MSCDITAFGKVRKIDLEGLTIEEKCKQLCTTLVPKVEFYEFQTSYKSWKECLLDHFYDTYIIIKDSLYEIDLTESRDDSYVCKINLTNVENEFSFYAHYYNGACSLEECLEEALIKFEEESILRTSSDWLALNPVLKIMDPDGWDRSDFIYSFYEEKISLKEFKNRLSKSSVISNY